MYSTYSIVLLLYILVHTDYSSSNIQSILYSIYCTVHIVLLTDTVTVHTGYTVILWVRTVLYVLYSVLYMYSRSTYSTGRRISINSDGNLGLKI